MKDYMEKQETICLGDCQVKKAKRGLDMDILVKQTTTICPSPKKFKVDVTSEDDTFSLEELKKKMSMKEFL